MTSTTRELYHDIRRALTYISRPSDYLPVHTSRPYSLTDAARRLKVKGVKAKRGQGPVRDAIVKFMVEERRPVHKPCLKTRLERRVASLYSDEIERRGGEVAIHGDRSSVYLHVRERRDGLTLLRAEGWRHYSKAFGARRATLAYLCGRDDNGLWAVRVPGTITSVVQAVERVEPAEVRKAREDGKRVLRQGDVYAVERARDAADQSDLPPRHTWDAATRILRHDDGHGDLHVPFNAKFIAQSTLRMGRLDPQGRRTGRGD